MTVDAHCDGPCGVYDPASTRVAAEAVLSMTKKLIALEAPSSTDSCLLYTSPSPRDKRQSRMPSSA